MRVMDALGEGQIEQRLAALTGWQRAGSDVIEREWKLADFAAAVAFVNRVAEAAEELDHHPDIRLHGWNKVAFTLSTHSAGGLTDADFELARRIDALAP